MSVYNDPHQLRAFAEDLRRFAGDVDQMREQTSGALYRLGDTWQDDQFRAFADGFGTTYRLLERFIDETEAVLPRLKELSSRLEDAQRVNPRL